MIKIDRLKRRSTKRLHKICSLSHKEWIRYQLHSPELCQVQLATPYSPLKGAILFWTITSVFLGEF